MNKLKIGLGITATLLASSVLSTAQAFTCPELTKNDVRDMIENGTIATEQNYSLADEAGTTRAQVLINEPTANPFDTYYRFYTVKTVENTPVFFAIENVLAGSTFEAKHRAKQILLKDATTFTATYDEPHKSCDYKQIDASPSIPNYPFKSTYESVSLNGILIFPEASESFLKKMIKKHRN